MQSMIFYDLNSRPGVKKKLIKMALYFEDYSLEMGWYVYFNNLFKRKLDYG